MIIEFEAVDSLIPDPKNARTHSEEQVEKLAALITEFGWTMPILRDTHIRAGHGRQMAARLIYSRGGRIRQPNGDLLPEGTVPTMDCTGWNEKQKRAYMLADNRSALDAGWDTDMLIEELTFLRDADFDLELTAFDTMELNDYFRLPNDNDPEEVPPVAEVAISQAGDLWILGDHRIICGSSTDPETVKAVIGFDKPNLMVTDPPYGVEYDADWRNNALRADGKKIGGRAIGKVENDDIADWSPAWALFPGNVAYVWHAGNMAHIVAQSLIACGLDIRAQIIWNKSNMVIGRGDYHPKHEPCWYAVRKGKKGDYVGGRKQTTVWDIDKPQKSETGHSTQKPLECMKRPIENNSKKGEAIYEPFSGSGTTIIACEMTGRKALAIELNPLYVDMAVRRWQQFTEQQAVHADGRTFDEVEAAVMAEQPEEAELSTD